MTGAVTSLVVIALLAVLSGVADRCWRQHERLPMQWDLKGRPTWSAPRRLALAFLPFLAALVLVLILVLPGAGVAAERQAAAAFAGGTFVVCHLLHLWLISRHMKRS